MEQIIVDNSICNQRMDKFLKKYLPNASTSFLFKMMRKKNILLNEHKAVGNEILKKMDTITIYFSDETLEKFKISSESLNDSASQYSEVYHFFAKNVPILYEDKNFLIFNKPSGMLSQKSKVNDRSINEFGIGYLLETNQITNQTLTLNKPSICNRLDRNTSGIILFGKTLSGLQTLNELIKKRAIKKYYRCILYGTLQKPISLNGFLLKDEKTNKVKILNTYIENSSEIKTNIIPLSYGTNLTYVEIELITGKTHQIRAHVSSIGHPIIGDFKYGIKKINEQYKKERSIETQLLHAYRLEFPKMNDEFLSLSEKKIIAPIPNDFQTFLHTYFK